MAVILPILMFKDTHIKAQQMYYIPSFSKSSLIHEQYIHDIHCSSIGLNPLNRVPRVPQKSIGFKNHSHWLWVKIHVVLNPLD